MVHEDPSNHQIEHEADRDEDRIREANGLINEIDNKQELRTVSRVEDEELGNICKQILQDLEHCTTLEIHPREKLPKPNLTSDIEERAKRVLKDYCHEDKNIREITDMSMQWKRQME